LDTDLIMARIDPFGLGMSAFTDGDEQDACPFRQDYFEARQWQLGWEFGRARSSAFRFADHAADLSELEIS
jgi:hypothetical protein